MASGYISGETTLRPIRMGLAIMPGSAAGLRRAVELATRTWGGQAFPLLEAGRDDRRVLRVAAALGVDCLFPVGDDAELKVLAKTQGFDWVDSWAGRSPFNRDQEGLAEHLFRRRLCMTGTALVGGRWFIMFPGRRTTNSLTCWRCGSAGSAMIPPGGRTGQRSERSPRGARWVRGSRCRHGRCRSPAS